MKIDANSLPDDPEQLKQMLLELQQAVAEKDRELAQKDDLITEQAQQINQLIERYELAKRKQFGKSSEKLPGAGETFNEAEEILDEADKALLVEVDDKPATPVKRQPKRKPLPKELPRKVITIDLSTDEQVCGCCRSKLHKIGETRSEKLEFVPAHIKVIETIRPKYACQQCEQSGTTTQVKIAPMPPAPIPKGIATASLLSQLITGKYQYGLPLYRQEQIFNDYGISLSRQTMSDWLIRCSELLAPLYDELKTHLLKQGVIHADETPLKVINEEKSTSYMWIYCCGEDKPSSNKMRNIVLFDYQNSRAAQCPISFLNGYTNYLQVDGYIAYEKTSAILAGCIAHARRKFIEAKTAQGKSKTGKADVILSLIGKLYGIEANIKTKSVAEKYQARQEKSNPLIDKIHQWVKENKEKIPPKSKLGEAITYWHNQAHKLETYLSDGRINIDNNRAERAVKPFVIGRKNWLFSNTARGATASAILYSFIETARANGLLVDSYLQTCLDELAKKPDSLEYLLPWNIKQG
ncbi:IS66 family transposase [Colwellia sp. RSH04]|uniref:IS66 family transposase n=1 Tax=Colwellia sp. RSH04 TaxID=2305464 RepID=UPI000E58ED74|nr:IS66 family transposase [Colwellia sp. RSH04]RHW76456.1 IS66 family transposase [Colwellia sp. RSH04]